MNVFLLDEDHEERARAHCDVHVNKMLLEAVQMLNTALHKNGLDEYAFYQPTHTNHPWVEWTAGASENFEWLVEHARELGKEFNRRTGNNHTSAAKLETHIIQKQVHATDGEIKVTDWWVDEKITGGMTGDKVTPFPVCTDSMTLVPDNHEYSRLPAGPVEMYRDYYIDVKYPQDWFSYSVEPPDWLLDRV